MEVMPYAYTLVVLFGAIAILAIIKDVFHWMMCPSSDDLEQPR